jgi:hypothetical protein
MADREGFEPSVTFLPHTLSKRAHSTTLTPALGGREARKRSGAWQSIFHKFSGNGGVGAQIPGIQPHRLGSGGTITGVTDSPQTVSKPVSSRVLPPPIAANLDFLRMGTELTELSTRRMIAFPS